MLTWKSAHGRMMVVAHRGSSARAPENTLAAFRRAVDDGADAIECDVRLSGDGEVVVIHDSRLERTTNGRGRVSNHTVRELKKFDAGGWFGRAFRGERIPTLNEVFEALGGRIAFNIEVKSDRDRAMATETVKRCLEVVDSAGVRRTVLISSFHIGLVELAKRLAPGITAGVLYHPVMHIHRKPASLVRATGSEYFITSIRSLRPETSCRLRARGIEIGAYTINTRSALRRALNLGVGCVYTDFPREVKNLIHGLDIQ